MVLVRERWRSHLLQTLSGTDDGSPQWVRDLALGSDAGFFGPGSAAWAVHGGMATMVAGIRALLVQALHPGAMAGVHDWSRYREDPLGRLTGTIRWLITVTFGDRATAERSSAMVRGLHKRVEGEYVDAFGMRRTYRAGDPELIEWVHLAFTDSFLTCHEIWEARDPRRPGRVRARVGHSRRAHRSAGSAADGRRDARAARRRRRGGEAEGRLTRA